MWNLQAPDGEADVSYDRQPDDRDREADWWNQKCLTNLDLSSNMLTTIGPGVGKLLDLTVLNVCAPGVVLDR